MAVRVWSVKKGALRRKTMKIFTGCGEHVIIAFMLASVKGLSTEVDLLTLLFCA